MKFKVVSPIGVKEAPGISMADCSAIVAGIRVVKPTDKIYFDRIDPLMAKIWVNEDQYVIFSREIVEELSAINLAEPLGNLPPDVIAFISGSLYKQSEFLKTLTTQTPRLNSDDIRSYVAARRAAGAVDTSNELIKHETFWNRLKTDEILVQGKEGSTYRKFAKTIRNFILHKTLAERMTNKALTDIQVFLNQFGIKLIIADDTDHTPPKRYYVYCVEEKDKEKFAAKLNEQLTDAGFLIHITF